MCMSLNSKKIATKSNKFKFQTLDECSNILHSMRTYLKGQHNENKRQRTEPTKLVPISFIELKIKREKNEYVTLKTLFDSGASSTLVSRAAFKHPKKTVTKKRCSTLQQTFFQPKTNVG